MEITTSWQRRGRVEGQCNTILRQLNRKLGTLTESITEQIKSLEPNQLDSLTEELLDFQTLDDLTAWLANS